MHLKDTLVNFICEQNYYFSFYNNSCYLYNYKKVIAINENQTIFQFDGFHLDISGRDFSVEKMTKQEILIKGIIEDIKITYEK